MEKIYLKNIRARFWALVLLLLNAVVAFGQTTISYTSSSQFTVPVGVTSIKVEAWGGGGAGGQINNAKQGGGGGGGAYASSVLTVEAGQSYNVIVGAGGTAPGGAGGNSVFGSNLVVAAGGSGGSSSTGGLGGSTAASTGTTKNAGGTGGNANTANGSGGGGGGGSATATANGGDGGAGIAGGAGGAGGNGEGKGGNGGDNGASGSKGNPPGGGGGGKGDGVGTNSGAGERGQVRITYTTCTAPSIGTQPTAQSTTYGGNVSFTVAASNATGYQWQVNSGSGFTNISNGDVYTNATTATLTITKPTVAMSGYQYRCVVTGACTPNATSNSVGLTVNKKDITGSFTAGNKVYNGTNAATVLNRFLDPTAIVSSDNVELRDGTATFDNANAGTGKTVTLTGATLAGTQANNYNLTGVSTTTANITAKDLELSISANNKIYNGNTIASISEYLYRGKVGTDDVYISESTATFDNKNVGTGKTVTMTSATLAGTQANNYIIVGVITTTANITARAINVTAQTDSKPYDGTAASSVSPVGDALQSGDTYASVGTQAFNNKNVGTGKTLTASGASINDGNGGNNYSITYVHNTTGTISARAINVTAQTDSKPYDGTAASSVSPVGDALQAGDTYASVGTQAFNNKNVGTGKTLTASGASINDGNGGNNYSITYVSNTTGVISARSINVTAQTDSKPYDGTAASSVAPVGDALQAGDTYASVGTQAFDNKNVGTGKTLTASGASINDGNGGNNYSITYVSNTTGVISTRSINVTAQTDSKPYDGTAASSVAPVGDALQAGDTYASVGTQVFDNKNVGTGKTLTASGASINDGNGGNNYSITYVSNTTGVISAKALTVTGATAQNKTYNGDTDATITGGTLQGVEGSDVVTIATSTGTFASKNVANGIAVTAALTLGGADVANYSLMQPTGLTANITKKDVTGSFTASNKTYNGNASATVAGTTVIGKVGSDDVALTGTATFADANAGTSKTVTLNSATLGGSAAGNYNLTTVSTTTADITPRSLTVTVTANNKVYDGNDNATVTLSDNRLSVDASASALTVSYTSAKFIDANAGTNKTVTVSGLSLSGTSFNNYSLTSTTATTTATITPQNATPMSTAFYTGATFFWTTGPNSSTATLTLAATLKNSPNYGGDIRTAKVSFYVNNVLVAKNQPVGLVNSGDLTVGASAVNVQHNLGSATAANVEVRVEITGNYTSAQSLGTIKTIMVAVPVAGGQICGGADLNDDGSDGFIKGSSNVSFFVKYNKSLKNPQGGVTLLIKSSYNRDGIDDGVDHEYKISSNAISTLTVGQPTPANAQFTSKANVSELKNGLYEAIEGNCSMVFDLTDVSQSGNGDKVAMTVYRSKGGMWFTSKLEGSIPVEKAIETEPKGNISVSTATPTARESVEIEPVLLKMNVDVVASPNPVADLLNVVITEAGSQPGVRVQLFGMDQRLHGTYSVPVVEGRAQQTIDVKNLQEGLYILTVDGAHGRVTRKVFRSN